MILFKRRHQIGPGGDWQEAIMHRFVRSHIHINQLVIALQPWFWATWIEYGNI